LPTAATSTVATSGHACDLGQTLAAFVPAKDPLLDETRFSPQASVGRRFAE
jgi:hypothetical protein